MSNKKRKRDSRGTSSGELNTHQAKRRKKVLEEGDSEDYS
jgi:hypothetical protein